MTSAAVLQDLDPEALVLGGVLRLPAEPAADVLATLQDSDMGDPRHRLILAAIRALVGAGTAPEPGLVLAELQRTGAHKLFPAGRDPGVVLVDLIGLAPAAGSLPHYVQLVRDRALLTAATATATRIQQAVERGDVDNLLVIASQGLAELLEDRAASSAKSRLVKGGTFTLDVPDGIPAVWGEGEQVLWASGESLMIVGSPGVGKSTLTQQVVLARVGILPTALGRPVAVGRRVLYLACDRPPQVQRSFHRMVRPSDRDYLDDRLVVWKGPPPQDFAKHPGTLLEMAQAADADTVVIDSLKDVAIKLTDDEVGAGYNNARQNALVAGVELLELHHQTKRGGGGVGKPNTLADVYGSAWITAGAGSVVLLHGEAGDPHVELLHLKQPGEPVGPLDVVHDHQAGTSTISTDRDPLSLLRAADKLTAGQLARLLYVPDGSRQPKAAEVEKARRVLDRLDRQGHAYKRSTRGDDGAVLPTTYHFRPSNLTSSDPLTDPLTAHLDPEDPT